jgi:hypothetical protein
VPGLKLVSGAADLLSAAATGGHLQKLRLLGQLRMLEADVVLIDLGAGTSESVLDLFLLSDVSIVVVMPEPAIGGYRFVKKAHRRCAPPRHGGSAARGFRLRPEGSVGPTTTGDIEWVEAETPAPPPCCSARSRRSRPAAS